MDSATVDTIIGDSVRRLDGAAVPAWNAFVERMPEATFCHLAQWRDVLESVFGFTPYYLYTSDGGGITGILPLALVRKPPLRHALISTPFCPVGGCVAVDRQAENRLEVAAVALAERLGVDYLELRGGNASGANWSRVGHYHTFRGPLSPDAPANLKAISRKERAVVRKTLDGTLRLRIDEDADTLYRVYATSLRNLGSPVHPRRYFDTLRAAFADRSEILTVVDGNEAVTSVLAFYFRNEVIPYHAGGLPSARRLGAYHFMYWQLMLRAAERGAGIFDFGRSIEGTGPFAFKKNWGFRPERLAYNYHLVRARRPPNITPSNPKLRLISRAWSHLPLAVANRLGPAIVSVIA